MALLYFHLWFKKLPCIIIVIFWTICYRKTVLGFQENKFTILIQGCALTAPGCLTLVFGQLEKLAFYINV